MESELFDEGLNGNECNQTDTCHPQFPVAGGSLLPLWAGSPERVLHCRFVPAVFKKIMGSANVSAVADTRFAGVVAHTVYLCGHEDRLGSALDETGHHSWRGGLVHRPFRSRIQEQKAVVPLSAEEYVNRPMEYGPGVPPEDKRVPFDYDADNFIELAIMLKDDRSKGLV